MSNRVSTSVSLAPDLYKRMEEDPHLNRSEIVNQMLREYFSAGSTNGLTLRIEQLKRELEDVRAKEERLEEELQQLTEEKERQEENREDSVEEALEPLRTIPDHKLGPDNPAVKKKASDLPLSPSELAEKAKGQPAN